jgi:raffinose/stachyose/melibiose transport system substrate-binding protein
MKQKSKTWFRVGAVVAAAALSLTALSGCAPSAAEEDKTFTVWWYSNTDTAQYIAWTAALEELKAAHPDVTVEFEFKTWEQIEKSGNSILDSDKAPDLSEWNKGNGTAGSASQAELLVNLDDYAAEFGWDESLPASAKQVGQYTDGLMGSGSLYGVPTYGEYVSYFYNADMLDAAGIDPASLTSTEALEGAFDTFLADGVTPVAAADYMLVHLAYLLALNKADSEWVNAYEFFSSEVDFNDPSFTFSSETLQNWVKKGYINANASGATADDAVAAFTSGASPFMPAGTWLDGTVSKGATFNWGKMLAPGNDISVGSAGNVWVIPTNGNNPDLAAEFINLTLQPKYQNMMAENGGLPLLSDSSAKTDATTAITLPLFQELVANNGLGFYPDWPVTGYYDILKAAAIDLIAGNTTPEQYRETIGKFYADNVPE